MLARSRPTSGTVRGMENICGVYEKHVSEPRYYFVLDNGQDWKTKDPSVDLYLVNEQGEFQRRLLSLVNRGGSWRLMLNELGEDFIQDFGENFDMEGNFLFAERDAR